MNPKKPNNRPQPGRPGNPEAVPRSATGGRPLYAALLVLVFFSGFAALVYELLWFRQLGLVFGNTTQAAATVLTAFMLGLAWGAHRAQRWIARCANPIRLFGVLEAGIGLYALAVPAAFAGILACYQAAAAHVSHAAPLLTGLRFCLALLALLVPTTLMGASLPVLSEAALRSRDRFAARLGLLYGCNTAGASVGVLACGFALVPHWGVHATNLLAAFVNLSVGGLAWLLSRRASPVAATSTPEEQPVPTARRVVGLLPLAALCGFLALAFETVWFRALVLVFGSTSHSFAIMVAGFLVGLAIGSAALGRLAGKPGRAAWALSLALAGIGLWTFFSLRAYNAAPDYLLRSLVRFDFSYEGMLLTKAALASVFLLPLAVFSGLAFTAVVRLVREHTTSAGRAVGVVFSANALGSAVGAVVGGFALLPAFGLQWSLSILGYAALLLGLVAAWQFTSEPLSRRLGFAATLLVLGTVALLTTPRWDPLLLSSGGYFSPRTHVQGGQVVLRDRLRSVELPFYHEGATATVSVSRTADGRLYFSSDGKVEADTSARSMVLQRMMGHLPMLLHPDPRRVLNIGLGAGVTSGALSCYPNVQLEVAEIEPAVTNVAALWAPRNHDLISRGRFTLFINDGRNHLLVTTNSYDVITSDPFEPVVAGAASLYTVEHFRLARSRLAPGGMMAQFLPLYEMSRADFLMILRSFLRVFPRSCMFFTGCDTILLGLADSARFDLPTAAAKFSLPEVRLSLAEIGIDRPERLLDMLVLEIGPGLAVVDDGPVNTDDRPIIEFSAPRSALEYRADENQQVLLNYFGEIPAAHLAGLAPEAAETVRRGHEALRSLLRANLLRSAGDLDGCVKLLAEAARQVPSNVVIRTELVESLLLLAAGAQAEGNLRRAMEWNQAVLRVDPKNFWALQSVVWLAQTDHQPELAGEYLQRALEAYPGAALLLALRGRQLAAAGQPAAACEDFRAALQVLPRRADFWNDYAVVLERATRPDEAQAARIRARREQSR
jgi:spermidine synthase